MSETCIHVALFSNGGMGHLTPFTRLAAMLVNNNCKVTLITPYPTVSVAESKFISRFLSAFPQVHLTKFHLLPLDASTATTTDPFFRQYEAVRRSARLLPSLLDSISPPLSALVYDMSLVSPVLSVIESMCLPRYILFTSSARMFSLYSYYPTAVASKQVSGDTDLEIPGIPPILASSIPKLLLDPNCQFAKWFMEDSPNLGRLDGILINTFEGLEGKAVEALNAGKVVKGLPPIFPVGPLLPRQFDKEDQPEPCMLLKWLEDQPQGSVVYVSFGSRTAMTRTQIREIGKGLTISGCRFLWVVKDKIVDKDETDSLDEVLGDELVESMKDKGFVVKTWVDQVEILGHKAVGGFASHCGWNSVSEAAWHGVPILACPVAGDQTINAELVDMSGVGVWKKDWRFGGERVVSGEDIGKAIKDMMGNQKLKVNAANLRKAARKAVGVDGSSDVTTMKRVIQKWEKREG